MHHKTNPSHLASCDKTCHPDLPDCHQHNTARWVLPAGSQGGAVYMINATSLAVEQSSFVNNTALTGGGIYMSRVTDTYIYDTLFYSNNVTQEGGGIYSGIPPFHAALRAPVSTYLQIMKLAEHATSSLRLMDICKPFRQDACRKQSPMHGVCCCIVVSALVNVSSKCEGPIQASQSLQLHCMWLTIAATSHSLEAYIPSSTLSNNGCLHIA